MTKVPHIANLRVRATRLGYAITKCEAAYPGADCEYVLHLPAEKWEDMPMTTRYGIAAQIRQLEELAGIDEFGIPYTPTATPIGDNTDLTPSEIASISIPMNPVERAIRDEYPSASEPAIEAELRKRLGYPVKTPFDQSILHGNGGVPGDEKASPSGKVSATQLRKVTVTLNMRNMIDYNDVECAVKFGATIPNVIEAACLAIRNEARFDFAEVDWDEITSFVIVGTLA